MVKQQRSRKGQLLHALNIFITFNRLGVSLQFLLTKVVLKDNPSHPAEVDNILLVAQHNTWVLLAACLKVICKGRMHHSPRLIAGEREAQPSEDPCMAEPRFTTLVLHWSVGQRSLKPNGIQDLNHISWSGPSLMQRCLPPRTKGLLIWCGVASPLPLAYLSNWCLSALFHEWNSVEPMLTFHTVHQS